MQRDIIIITRDVWSGSKNHEEFCHIISRDETVQRFEY